MTSTADTSPPPWWEDGRFAGWSVVTAALAAQAAITVVDLALTGRISQLGDLCFVVVCLAMAAAVRPRDAYAVAIAPPVLMLLTVLAVALTYPAGVAEATDAPAQAVVSGLTHHSAALAGGFALCLVTLAVRLLARPPTVSEPVGEIHDLGVAVGGAAQVPGTRAG